MKGFTIIPARPPLLRSLKLNAYYFINTYYVLNIFTMENTFNEVVYLTLSEESQIKVEHIYVIASILHSHQMPQLNARDFDELYDKSIRELEGISSFVRFRCELKGLAETLNSMRRPQQEDDGN